MKENDDFMKFNKHVLRIWSLKGTLSKETNPRGKLPFGEPI